MMQSTIESCATCYSEFVADDPDDVSMHSRYCDEFALAVATLGYRPAPFVERERMKNLGREMMTTSWRRDDRVEGALLLLRGLYDLSLVGGIEGGYWHVHPRLDEFAGMLDLHRLFRADVATVLRARYAVRSWRGALVGNAYWEPAR